MLPLPDHANAEIVEQQDFDWNTVRAGRLEFAHVHADTAVAVDVDHEGIRLRELSAGRRGQAETHRPHAPRRQEVSRLDEIEELRSPHLMLANACADDCAPARDFA